MEIGDFSFFVMTPVLLIPLASIYYGLKILGWEFRDRLFMDSWFIWLVWLASALLSYLIVLSITSMLQIYWGISMFWWVVVSVTALFISNLLAISLLIVSIRRRRVQAEIHFFEDVETKPVDRAPVLRVSLITTMMATGSLVVSFGLASAVGVIYDHYYPKPPVKYGIYDI